MVHWNHLHLLEEQGIQKMQWKLVKFWKNMLTQIVDQFRGSGIMSGVEAIWFHKDDGIILLLIQKKKVLLGPQWSLALT